MTNLVTRTPRELLFEVFSLSVELNLTITNITKEPDIFFQQDILFLRLVRYFDPNWRVLSRGTVCQNIGTGDFYQNSPIDRESSTWQRNLPNTFHKQTTHRNLSQCTHKQTILRCRLSHDDQSLASGTMRQNTLLVKHPAVYSSSAVMLFIHFVLIICLEGISAKVNIYIIFLSKINAVQENIQQPLSQILNDDVDFFYIIEIYIFRFIILVTMEIIQVRFR